MIQSTPPKAKMTLYGIVRGPDGKPKVDDPATLHPVQIGMLTPDERAELGIEEKET